MKMKIVGAAVAAVLLIGGAVVASSLIATDHHHHDGTEITGHGGGLDQCGGHMNHKTGLYHYHRGPYC